MSPIRSTDDPRWPDAVTELGSRARGAVVIWDFDGVIADTEPVHAESYRVLLERRGLTPQTGFFEPMVGTPEPEIWRKLADLGLDTGDPLEDLVVERRQVVLDLARRTLRPSWVAAEAIPLLADVAAEQCVVSAGDTSTIGELLALWELDGRVTLDTSAGSKPERLASRWSAGPTVTIEDSAAYLESAKAAGSYCVAVHHSLSRGRFPDVDLEFAI